MGAWNTRTFVLKKDGTEIFAAPEDGTAFATMPVVVGKKAAVFRPDYTDGYGLRSVLYGYGNKLMARDMSGADEWETRLAGHVVATAQVTQGYQHFKGMHQSGSNIFVATTNPAMVYRFRALDGTILDQYVLGEGNNYAAPKLIDNSFLLGAHQGNLKVIAAPDMCSMDPDLPPCTKLFTGAGKCNGFDKDLTSLIEGPVTWKSCWEECLVWYGDTLVSVNGPEVATPECHCQDKCEKMVCAGSTHVTATSLLVRSSFDLSETVCETTQ